MNPDASQGARRIAGVVVTFGPDPTQLHRLLEVLLRECGAVYMMDNGGGRAAIDGTALHAVRVVDMQGNAGLGAALNRAFDAAAGAGCEYVATFDQDSDPAPGQIAALTEVLEQQIAGGSNVAAVGPRIIDVRESKAFEHPFVRTIRGWPSATFCTPGVDYVETDFLITSGTVVSIAAYRRIGPYDAGLFVDFTDIDWCFRAVARGYRLLGVCAISMPHELGTGVTAKALGITIVAYAPMRRYYYARNAVLLARRPHVSVGWKARLLVGVLSRLILLPVAVKFSSGWTRSWTMLARGFKDGLKRCDGAYSGSG